MVRRRIDIFLVVALLALLGALVSLRPLETPSSDLPTTRAFMSEEAGVRFSYPSAYEATAIGDSLRANDTFFRAVTGDQRALLTVRRETGLGVLKLTGGTVLASLVANANRQLPERFAGFVKVSTSQRTVGAESAELIEFTYTGADGRTVIRQLQAIVVVRDNEGYFFSLQTPDRQFEVHRDDFATLLDSVRFSAPNQ